MRALDHPAETRGFTGVAGTSAAERLRRLIAYRTLIKYLVLKDIKVKSRGTYLGVAWTLVNPLFMIIVYFVVFRHVFRVGIPNFLVFFLLGYLMWVFFSRAVTMAATCIPENQSLVKRLAFPLEVLPLTVVLYHLFHHVIALGIALPLMMAFAGAKLSWHLVWVPALVAAFTAFALAVALWLATIGVFFRDARDILEVVLPMFFWATPIVYSPDMAPASLQLVFLANPLSSFIGAMRTVVLDGRPPSPEQLGWMVLWLALTLISGPWVFGRYWPRFAEEC